MKQLFFATALILLGLTACKKDKIAPPAQEDAFIKYYGHIGEQYVNDMATTADGGYIVVGQSNSYFDALVDYSYLVKTDSLGNELWSVTLGPGSLTGFREVGKVVVPLSTGDGYIVGCDRMTLGNNSSSKIVLYRVDLEGNVVWEAEQSPNIRNSVNGVNQFNGRVPSDFVVDIKETPAGGFVVYGETTSVGVKPDINTYGEYDRLDVLHFLVDDAGVIVPLSEKVRGNIGEDRAVGVEVITNGNIIVFTATFEDLLSVAGQTPEFFEYVSIAAFNNNLVSDIEEWTRFYSLSGSNLIASSSTIDTVSSPVNTGFAVVGYVRDSLGISEPFEGDMFLIKMEVDFAGQQVGTASDDDISYYGRSSGNLNGVTDNLIAAGIEAVPPTTQGASASYIVTATHSSGTGGEAMLAEIAAGDSLLWDEVRFFGLSTSQPNNTAGNVVPIVGQVSGTTLTEVDGYVFTGNFNVGTNPMIGLIRTNNQGLLISRPAEEN